MNPANLFSGDSMTVAGQQLLAYQSAPGNNMQLRTQLTLLAIGLVVGFAIAMIGVIVFWGRLVRRYMKVGDATGPSSFAPPKRFTWFGKWNQEKEDTVTGDEETRHDG